MRVVQTRQPVGPVRLDRSNPLTAGLIDVFVPGHRVNLVSGLSLAATGTASFVGVSQIGISLISSSVSNHFHAVSTPPANVRVDEATLLVVTATSSTAETTRSMYGFGSTGSSNPLLFIGQCVSANQLYFFAKSDSGTAQNTTVTPPSGTWAQDQKAVIVGARSQAGNVHQLYVNGIQAATTTATTIGATTLNATSVGGLRRNTDGLVYNGRTSLCLAWNRCLSAAEIKSISDNPWQIFEPIVVPVKSPAASGTTVAPAKGSLTFTGKVPTVAQTANQTVAPSKGALTFTGYVPTVTRTDNQTVAPAKGALAFTGKVPTVTRTDNQTVAPAKGALTFTGYVPTVTQDSGTVIAPSKGALTFTGGIPTVTQTANQIIVPSKGALTFTGKIPTVTQTGAVTYARAPRGGGYPGTKPTTTRGGQTNTTRPTMANTRR